MLIEQKPTFIKEILLDEKTINQAIQTMAVAIEKTYQTSKIPLILIGALKGCVFFMTKLAQTLKLDFAIDFLVISSFAGGLEANITPEIIISNKIKIAGKNVLFVEDIIDSGNSIIEIKNYILKQKPHSFKIAALLDKKITKHDLKIDFLGFEVPNEFLIGYGLDYNERFRHLPYVASVNIDVIKKIKIYEWDKK